MSPDDRVLALQVQNLTGITNINVIISAMGTLRNMDPNILQTLSHIDQSVIQQTLRQNPGSGMQIIQNLIQHIQEYHGPGPVGVPIQPGNTQIRSLFDVNITNPQSRGQGNRSGLHSRNPNYPSKQQHQDKPGARQGSRQGWRATKAQGNNLHRTTGGYGKPQQKMNRK